MRVFAAAIALTAGSCGGVSETGHQGVLSDGGSDATDGQGGAGGKATGVGGAGGSSGPGVCTACFSQSLTATCANDYAGCTQDPSALTS